MSDYDNLKTEKANGGHKPLENMTTLEFVSYMNDEDHNVADAVKSALPEIAAAIEFIAEKMRVGGRLFYLGAGTSGRLGVLDSVECPPTFGIAPEIVQGLIVGGRDTMFNAAEGEEDETDSGIRELRKAGFKTGDILVGISASGSAASVGEALKYAKGNGGGTVALVCNKEGEIIKYADFKIAVDAGSEVLMGSTRLKAGTAQKMILNMISTGVMLRLGRIKSNYMVCMRPTNKKLINRALNIIAALTNANKEEASVILEKNGYNIENTITYFGKISKG